MVLPRSLWLLSVCLLFWCCDAWKSRLQDPESESDPLPVVIWDSIENIVIMASFKNIIEKTVPGIYVLPIEVGKKTMKDVENKVLNVSSQVCQILAQHPKLQDGYISVTFSKGIQFLRSVAETCPIPVMRDMISLSAKNFLRDLKRFVWLY